jgi:hypothetical protein
LNESEIHLCGGWQQIALNAGRKVGDQACREQQAHRRVIAAVERVERCAARVGKDLREIRCEAAKGEDENERQVTAIGD